MILFFSLNNTSQISEATQLKHFLNQKKSISLSSQVLQSLGGLGLWKKNKKNPQIWTTRLTENSCSLSTLPLSSVYYFYFMSKQNHYGLSWKTTPVSWMIHESDSFLTLQGGQCQAVHNSKGGKFKVLKILLVNSELQQILHCCGFS